MYLKPMNTQPNEETKRQKAAERQRKHRAKLKAGDPRLWPILKFKPGTFYFRRKKLLDLIMEMISYWKIPLTERAMLAYIAERKWSGKGRVQQSICEMSIEIKKTSGKTLSNSQSWKLQYSIFRSVFQLERRGLIRCTTPKEWETMSASRKEEYYECGGEFRFKILNVPLRTLMETGRGELVKG
jgi:hypothetical protein